MDETESKDALLLALLPEVPFDGWTRAAIRAAAVRAGLDAGEASALFPKGPRDAVAWFSNWADRQTLAALRAQKSRLRLSERIAFGVTTRLQILLPHREALRRGLTLLALPQNMPVAAKLLYDTVDTLWHGAGDKSTDFNFYTKRALLAGVYAATTLYWLDDRSDGAEATAAFLDRRLHDVLAITRLREKLPRVPNPLSALRAARTRFSGAGSAS